MRNDETLLRWIFFISIISIMLQSYFFYKIIKTRMNVGLSIVTVEQVFNIPENVYASTKA